MDDMSWKACLNSEVFCNYIAAEEVKAKKNIKTAEDVALENLEILNDFEDFQVKVNSSIKLKDTFKKLQQLFLTNEKYASTVDPLFVESVLLLKID